MDSMRKLGNSLLEKKIEVEDKGERNLLMLEY